MGAPTAPFALPPTCCPTHLQVIAGCPPDQRSDLLFTQNGMLLPLLERHGLACNTQALLYMSAVDGSVVDGGRTVACGRCAAVL